MARIKSTMFISARKGTPGRRATRWLSDESVAKAKAKAKNEVKLSAEVVA